MQTIIRGALTGSVCIWALAGCNADTGTIAALAPTVNTGSMTEIALPEVLRTAQSIDPAGLQLQVRVNNVTTVLTPAPGNLWRGSVNVPANQTSGISVEWGTDYGTAGYIKLAEQQKIVYISAAETDVIFDNNYRTDFDRDRDARNNLTELIQNRSPVHNLDVTINTDGTFTTGGVAYPVSATCGHQLPVAIKTLDNESDHTAWWCAKIKSELTDADGNLQFIENLEVTVNVADDQLFTDSGTGAESISYEDDSVEIYIDGDNNKRSDYDGINDYQFRFAPLGEGVFSKVRGPAGTPLNLNGRFTYYNGGYILHATIPLDQVGIRKGFPFGLNVEVNDDDDGGPRDAKYSWIGTEGEDVAWRNTQAFGTSQL